MTPRQFYRSQAKERVAEVAEAAGTTFANFKQIAVSRGSVGKELAERLCRASGGAMTELEILYPERYETAPTVQIERASHGETSHVTSTSAAN